LRPLAELSDPTTIFRVPMIPRTLTAVVIASVIALAGAVYAQPLTRVAATSLRLPAVPPASNYSTERVFASLAISQPIALVEVYEIR
jgi:hypothetical protein